MHQSVRERFNRSNLDSWPDDVLCHLAPGLTVSDPRVLRSHRPQLRENHPMGPWRCEELTTVKPVK
jgi:hypothetical protein